MKIYNKKIKLKTLPNKYFLITDYVRDVVRKSGIINGFCIVSNLGSTGAVIINEYDPSLMDDLRNLLEKIIPKEKDYNHPFNSYSHLRTMLFGSSKIISIKDNDLELGTWQEIIFLEFDIKQRSRNILVKVIGE
ncbi:MAG: YjbQ family protein [Candidatus Aenigmarchaeota archaeon]|nr:YjbQ family protein [Candidatus Aenigmarchaeota archaeon]